jgi:hypothetical protein
VTSWLFCLDTIYSTFLAVMSLEFFSIPILPMVPFPSV